nr:TPA_asm: hypothetical protein [Ladona dragonfly adintovirus]
MNLVETSQLLVGLFQLLVGLFQLLSVELFQLGEASHILQNQSGSQQVNYEKTCQGKWFLTESRKKQSKYDRQIKSGAYLKTGSSPKSSLFAGSITTARQLLHEPSIYTDVVCADDAKKHPGYDIRKEVHRSTSISLVMRG